MKLRPVKERMGVNPREILKRGLIHDPARKVTANGRVYTCEGQWMLPHKCKGGYEMDEVFYPRNTFQSLPERSKRYFWTAINCAIVCSHFHTKHGQTDRWRKSFLQLQLQPGRFTEAEIRTFLREAPLRYRKRLEEFQ